MALRAGVAQLIVPMGFDQQLWAERVEALGVGASVGLDELTPGLDGHGWGAALRRVFDPAVARAAGGWAMDHNAPAAGGPATGGGPGTCASSRSSQATQPGLAASRFSECASGGAQAASRCVMALAGVLSDLAYGRP